MNEAQTAPQRVPGLSFTLQAGESVLRICRRHWIYLWPRILLMAAFALIPISAIALLLSSAGAYEGTTARVFWVVAGVYLIFWAVRIFLVWYTYKHDLWVITNQRLVDSYKRHPLSLRVSSADLVNVQDMTVERDGLLRTVLDYGDVLCQTAGVGAAEAFRIAGVPNPRDVQALVDRERDRERTRGRGL